MSNCKQTETQNVLEHGQSVWSYTKKIISGDWVGLKIPQWLTDNHTEIVNNLHPSEVIKMYNVYHDCGKPFCLTIDEDGKRHYPNHAQVSKETFQKYFDVKNKDIIAHLIGSDMDLHTLTAKEIDELDWIKKDAFTLLITALAELHSNAALFGGIESVSFKSKWKKIDQRGKQLCRKFIVGIEHKYTYVIVRNDIPNAAKTVQSIHAAVETFVTEDYKHSSIVCVVVKNEYKLKKVIGELLDLGINFKIFREPLLGNTITAIATETLEGESRKYLQKFQLLS